MINPAFGHYPVYQPYAAKAAAVNTVQFGQEKKPALKVLVVNNRADDEAYRSFLPKYDVTVISQFDLNRHPVENQYDVVLIEEVFWGDGDKYAKQVTKKWPNLTAQQIIVLPSAFDSVFESDTYSVLKVNSPKEKWRLVQNQLASINI